MAVYQILIHFLSKSVHFLIKRNAFSYSQQNINSHTSAQQHSIFFSLSIYPAGWILTWNSTTLPIGATPAGTWACYSLKEARAQILTHYKLVQLHQFCKSAANLQWLGMWPNIFQLLTESRRATQPLRTGRRSQSFAWFLTPSASRHYRKAGFWKLLQCLMVHHTQT